MKNSYRALVALAIVAAIGAAFWWLDFRAASSQTNATSQVATASASPSAAANGASGQHSPDQPRPEVVLYVAGDDQLSDELREDLVSRLRSSGLFGSVTSLDAAPAEGSGPTTLVEVEGGEGTWTPVYSRARLTAKLAYASNGDATLEDRPSAKRFGPNERAVNIKGDLQVDDVTWGLTSRPAYHRHLGRQIAGQVADALIKALEGARG